MTSLLNQARLDVFSHKPEVQRRLVQLYLDTTPGIVQAIEAALADGDTQQVAFNAHALKGSSADMGAERLAELSQQLQQAARIADQDAVRSLSAEVFRCHQETMTALQSLLVH